jgi:hypothetical protein
MDISLYSIKHYFCNEDVLIFLRGITEFLHKVFNNRFDIYWGGGGSWVVISIYEC